MYRVEIHAPGVAAPHLSVAANLPVRKVCHALATSSTHLSMLPSLSVVRLGEGFSRLHVSTLTESYIFLVSPFPAADSMVLAHFPSIF